MTRCKLQAKKCKFWDNTNIEERFIEQLIIGAISRKPPPKKTGPVKEKFCKRCGLTHSKYLVNHVQHGEVLAMSVEKRTIGGECATRPKIQSQETREVIRQAPG